LYERVELLDALIEMLDYTNEALMVVEGYRDGLYPVLMRAFALKNLERIEDFARAYAQHVGASTLRALCEELKDLLEGGDTDG